MSIRRLTSDQAARLAWARISEPSDEQVSSLIAADGAAGALEKVRRGETPPGVKDQRWRGWVDRLQTVDVERELSMAARVRARIVFPDDEEWPDSLADLPTPPHCLWVQGPLRLDDATRQSCAIVGSRAATAYGRQLAHELGYGVASRGHTVVSGAAFGIDIAAHLGALAAEGVTVALLACGLDRDYPTAHAQILRRLRAESLVVSELPVGAVALRPRFLARNRLIDLSVGEECAYAYVVAGQTANCVRDMCRSPGALRRNRAGVGRRFCWARL